MNCSWSEERFEAFLDGELDALGRARLIGHVDACGACRALLEELRCVDALLLRPRRVGLSPAFTHATMAAVHAMPAPAPRRVPLLAFAVCYLVGAWLLIAAAFLIAPQTLRALAETLIDLARTIVDTAGGLGHVFTRLQARGSLGSLVLFVGVVLLLETFLGLAFTVGIRAARPRLAERLRP